ncbi:MAG: peptide chain release factor 1 [Planctomycetota bacterium]|nr:MAG: peptide chain release factor 1 [Planctomycetota bacterium]
MLGQSNDLLQKLAHVAARHEELEQQLADPVVASSREYPVLVREHGRLSRVVEPYRAMLHEQDRLQQAESMLQDSELAELAREECHEAQAACEALLEQVKAQIVQGDALADRTALMEVRAGTGGEEACLFAGDLVRMYQLHAQRRGWRIELIDASESEQGGFKEAILEVRGEGAYGLLRYESGGHRVQRVPQTESQGRVHTSAATVAVLPEADEVEVAINDDDLVIERKRAGGAGGQHVNKTESAIRVTHKPTGIVASCQDQKSQGANLDRAMKVLRSRLFEAELQRTAAARAAERKGQIGSGDRSDRIRTYNVPQNRITDHRINWTSYDLDRYLQGHLEDVQQAMIDHAKVSLLEHWDGVL